MICTGGFSPSVHNLATNNQITLIDKDSLAQMHINNS
ncbi:MAG: restriction endonuclease [Desulfobulbaceae bacterium]|nr:restriction endonuclease [Desulfobulbaceae bacterium]